MSRRLAGDDPAVNEEWNCDKGRWGFRYSTAVDRITTPMVRDAKTGELREASWPEALRVAAEGLARARDSRTGVAVLTGGRLTVEDAYAYSKFARVALHTNDIDFRARPLSGEEADFLASSVAGITDVTYGDVDCAPAVVLVGLEPEEECPILFLRLRKAYLQEQAGRVRGRAAGVGRAGEARREVAPVRAGVEEADRAGRLRRTAVGPDQARCHPVRG